MKYYKTNFILVIFLFNLTLAYSQDHHDHSHLENEIGLSSGVLYCPEHKEWGVGTHLHYFRLLSPHSKWSFGGMFEKVWSEDDHLTIGAGAKYQILDRWSIGLLPGVTFFKHHGETEYESAFSMHFETVYDLFHWEKFHLGPVLDYSWAKNDSHLSLGVHVAYCF